jgi:hypothetical protein
MMDRMVMFLVAVAMTGCGSSGDPAGACSIALQEAWSTEGCEVAN